MTWPKKRTMTMTNIFRENLQRVFFLDFWPLRHLLRVARKHDLTNNKDKDNDKYINRTPSKSNLRDFRPQGLYWVWSNLLIRSLGHIRPSQSDCVVFPPTCSHQSHGNPRHIYKFCLVPRACLGLEWPYRKNNLIFHESFCSFQDLPQQKQIVCK